jgi:ribosome-associated toxin RatA of RatAB toxin-antitoxin module
MAVYESTQTVEIAAPPQACFDVLTDYAHMPEWQSRVVESRVLSTDQAGHASEVQYAIDVTLRTVRYRLAHTYDAPSFIGSVYLGGDFRDFAGDYRLQPSATGTRVIFHLRIDPGLRIPRPIARMLNEAVMGRALQDLKRRVEAVSRGAH